MLSSLPHARPIETEGVPYGTAYLAASHLGIDLAERGYVEEEYLLDGAASRWLSRDAGSPEQHGSPELFTTRVLVRRPLDPASTSGVVHLEPLHPHMDAGLTWEATAPYLMREGHTWVGVTVFAHMATLLRERVDPTRYRELNIPFSGAEWDVLSDAAQLLREGALGVRARTVILSGWSATGSFCRVYARERFGARRGAVTDGVIVFISSGGAGEAGYPRLSEDDDPQPQDDERRTLRSSDHPIFEVLSETESETHEAQTREDADDLTDRYRLYEVAGTAHIEDWPHRVSTNAVALAAAGVQLPEFETVETRSDARLDLVARAALDLMRRWIEDDVAPPRVGRFSHTGPALAEGRALTRDADGNVVGGVRTPWVDAPLASYAPHSTPTATNEPGAAWSPMSNPVMAARLVGAMTTLPSDTIAARYDDAEDYVRRFGAATRTLQEAGLLLAPDAEELIASAPERWRRHVG